MEESKLKEASARFVKKFSGGIQNITVFIKKHIKKIASIGTGSSYKHISSKRIVNKEILYKLQLSGFAGISLTFVIFQVGIYCESKRG